MRPPIIVVTGGIASGKTLVARVLAERGGVVVDCDSVGHEALAVPALKRKLVEAFGEGILTVTGKVSRTRLGRIVFSDAHKLELLNRLIRPVLKEMISAEVKKLKSSARYIVLDAVLFFQYKFNFKVDFVVVTEASEKTRLKRLMQRDGLRREEALQRIERQKSLHDDWDGAGITINTDGPLNRVMKEVAHVRDRFLQWKL